MISGNGSFLTERELCFLSIIRSFPYLTGFQADLVYQWVRKEKIRIPRILSSLQRKNILVPNRDHSQTSQRANPKASREPEYIEAADVLDTPLEDVYNVSHASQYCTDRLELDPDLVKTIASLPFDFRIGIQERRVLAVMRHAKRMSLKFLSVCMHDTQKNIFPVLQRMLEKNLVYSYYSIVQFRNQAGRLYRPKFYGLTKFGDFIAVISCDVANSRKKERVESTNSMYNNDRSTQTEDGNSYEKMIQNIEENIDDGKSRLLERMDSS